MGDAHEAIYSRLSSLISGDLDQSAGLAKTGQNNYVYSVERDQTNRPINSWPSIRVGISTESPYSPGGEVHIAKVTVMVYTNRDSTGYTVTNSVLDRLRTVLDGAFPQDPVAGYRVSRFEYESEREPRVEGKWQVHAHVYTVLATESGKSVFLIPDRSRPTWRHSSMSGMFMYIVVDSQAAGDSDPPTSSIGLSGGVVFGNSVVSAITRERMFNRDDAMYAVYYRTRNESFGDTRNRAVSVQFGQQSLEVNGYLKKVTQNGERVEYVPVPFTAPRTTFARTETVTKPAGESEVQSIQGHIADDAGKLRLIGGMPYIFNGATLTYNPENQTVMIEAQFWSTSRVKAIGSVTQGGEPLFVGIPALGPLEEYREIPAQVDGSGRALSVPQVVAQPASDFFETGDFTWLA